MPKRTALLIQNTAFSDAAIADLPASSIDLQALAEVLTDPNGGGYQVKTLVDRPQQELREELARLYRAQEPEDLVLLVCFGHALLDQFGEIYLAAVDTRVEMIDATGLRLGYLRDQLDRSQSAAKVVLLDCPVTAIYPGGRDLLNTSAGVLEALAGNRQGRALLTSSDQVEAALGGNGGAGKTEPKPFGRLLVEGFATGAADNNQDGVITPAELHEYLYRETQAQAPSLPPPSKYTSPNAANLRLASNRARQPVDLPHELKQALTSPMEWMREGALGELERLLTSESRGISRAAHDALSSLAGDQTPHISRSATAILQQYERSHSGKTAPEAQPRTERQGVLSRIPISARIAVGVVLLFVVGIVAGMAGLFRASPAEQEPEASSTQALVSQPATQALTPIGQAESTVVLEPTSEPAAELPSSIGMLPVQGGTYPIAANQAGEVANFWIDQFEVTNSAYAAFVESTGAPIPAYWTAEDIPAQNGNHPVHGVQWDLAQAYCRFVDKRLPTEIEWEVAARGPNGYPYPWGRQANAVPLPAAGTYPVGSIPANRSFFGVYDMAGNVWEWVDHPYLPTDENERVLRGGANNFPNDMLKRLVGDPTASATIADAGFRCAAGEVQIQIDSALLLTDEFADVQSGWFQARAPVQEYFYGYHPSDFYHVQVSAPEDCLAVRHDLELTDFVADVEIFQAAAATEDGNYRYGLMIRESAGDYYAFLASPRAKTWRAVKGGAAGIAIMDEGTNESLGGLTRDTRDRLTVIADGAQFSFFINGELVSQVYDAEFPSGNLGFVVQTLDETYAHIHFDRIFVRQLPRNATPVAEIPSGINVNYSMTEPACGGSVSGDDLLDRFFTYTVKEGDTLSAIANLFGLSVVELKGANGRRIQDPNVIVVGQTLIIPQQ